MVDQFQLVVISSKLNAIVTLWLKQSRTLVNAGTSALYQRCSPLLYSSHSTGHPLTRLTLKEPLRAPIVSCPLGKLYNKEAILSHLLSGDPASSPFGNDGILIAAHIRNLKDLTTLNLTTNPSLASADADDDLRLSNNLGTMEEHRAALYVCPISLREMNGTVKFVYRKPCGCVLSESSIKEMRRAEVEAGGEAAEGEEGKLVCPVCVKSDGPAEEWVTLNPQGEEAEEMREQWEARKVREKAEKKAAKAAGGKKRKETATDAAEPNGKKLKSSSALSSHAAPAIKAGSSVPLLSATLAAKIAEQKKTHSPAVASLYAKKGGDANHVSSGVGYALDSALS